MGGMLNNLVKILRIYTTCKSEIRKPGYLTLSLKDCYLILKCLSGIVSKLIKDENNEKFQKFKSIVNFSIFSTTSENIFSNAGYDDDVDITKFFYG